MPMQSASHREGCKFGVAKPSRRTCRPARATCILHFLRLPHAMNVGLRDFVWKDKNIDAQVQREAWQLNDCPYDPFRKYVSSRKEELLLQEQDRMRLPSGGSQAAGPEYNFTGLPLIRCSSCVTSSPDFGDNSHAERDKPPQYFPRCCDRNGEHL